MANYFTSASDTGDAQVFTGAGRLLGVSIRETAGSAAAATVVLRDGTSTSGAQVAAFELAGDQTVNGTYGDIDGIEVRTGLFIDRVAGTTEVTVYY